MKKHALQRPRQLKRWRDSLCTVLSRLQTEEECCRFLEDLCTPAELEAMADRWKVVGLVDEGIPYREINEMTGVSVTTIGRVARSLVQGTGGYRIGLDYING